MKVTTIATIAPIDISPLPAPETGVVWPLPVYVAVELGPPALRVLDPPEF